MRIVVMILGFAIATSGSGWAGSAEAFMDTYRAAKEQRHDRFQYDAPAGSGDVTISVASVEAALNVFDEKRFTPVPEKINRRGSIRAEPCATINTSVRQAGYCAPGYLDERFSIYRTSRGLAIAHAKITIDKESLEKGRDNAWDGDSRYGPYTLDTGYFWVPPNALPSHVIVPEECAALRVGFDDPEVRKVLDNVFVGREKVAELILELDYSYTLYASAEPLIVLTPCFLVVRSDRGRYQNYLGPLRR